MNSAGSETALHDLETASLTEAHVALVHPDVVEADVAMTMGGIIEAHDRKHSVDGNAWSVGRYENDGLLFVDVLVVGVGLAHDDVDFAAAVSSTA